MSRINAHIKTGTTALFVMVMGATPSGRAPAQSGAASPELAAEITLELNDTTVSPYDSIYYLSVFLTNATRSVAGMQIDLQASRPDLVSLADSGFVDTIVLCIDTVDCDPADTIYSTGLVLEGSAIMGWDFLDGSALSSTYFHFVGLADDLGGGSPPPLAPPASGSHFLFRVALKREASLDMLDTLSDRMVAWHVNPIGTIFADSNGTTIGSSESNVYVSGSITIEPNCLVGDVNDNGTITSADVISLVNYVFKSGALPTCDDGRSGDTNCSGAITSADVIYLVNFVFKGGQAPCEA